jgi:hypothetical protein
MAGLAPVWWIKLLPIISAIATAVIRRDGLRVERKVWSITLNANRVDAL